MTSSRGQAVDRPDAGREGATHPGSRLLVPIIVAAATFQAILQTVLLPLLPEMPSYTGAGRTAVSWLITITLVVGAVVTPVFGKLADMYGRKRMLLVAFSSMTLGSLLCALFTDLAVLIPARALQGVGSAVIPIGIAMFRAELPAHRVNSSVALLSSTLGFGSALAIPFSAGISQVAGWHLIFWITTGLGIALTTVAALCLHEPGERTGGRFDAVGALGLGLVMVTLLVPVTQGGNWGWSSAPVVAMIPTSLLLLAAWIAYQRRRPNPFVDVRAAVRAPLLIPHVATLLVGFAFFGNMLITTQLLQGPGGAAAGYELSMLTAALCQVPASIVLITLAPVSARLTGRFGARTTLLIGAMFLATGYCLHAVPGKPLWGVVVALSITAVGTAFCYSTLPLLILAVVPPQHLAAENGVNSLLRTTGSTLCSATAATVLAAFALDGSEKATSWSGFAVAYLVCAACAAVVFAVSTRLPRRAVSRDR